MEFIKKVIIRIILVMAFIAPTVLAITYIVYAILVYQGHQALKQDIHALSSLLEQENCLSIDEIDGSSRYAKFVNEYLRSSETPYFKYNIEVRNNKPRGNTALGADSFNGVDDPENPLQVSATSYTDCPNRGETITASLTAYVYGPTFFKSLEGPDSFSHSNHRMRCEITETVSVIGGKKYKGKS